MFPDIFDMTTRRIPMAVVTLVTALLVGSAAPATPAVPAVASGAGNAGSVGEAPLRIGEIRIVASDIYSDEDLAGSNGVMRTIRKSMNALHFNTRSGIIRRELLFGTGDVLDPRRLRETERNLRALGYLANVTIVPTDTLPGGIVPLEVRVQETWSLNGSATYSHSAGRNRWLLELFDDNFLGQGVEVRTGIGKDEDRSYTELHYKNRRLFGSPYLVSLVYDDFSDGYAREATLSRPYYAEETPWGLTFETWDRRYTPRYYLSQAGPLGVGGQDRLYASLPIHEHGVSGWLGKRLHLGESRVWRAGLGLWVSDKRFDVPAVVDLSDGRVVSGDALVADASPALGRESGHRVQPLLTVETMGRHWTTERYVLSYGPQEDLNLDPWVRLTAGPALASLGSDRERYYGEWKVQDWSRLGRGFLYLSQQGQGSLGSRANRMVRVETVAGWWARSGESDLTHLTAEGSYGEDMLGTDAFVLGLTRGLRSVDYDGRAGDRLLRWNAEHVHLLPGELMGFFRVGVAAFYSGGTAWWRGDDRALAATRHEVGLGLRLGPTRSASAEVSRLDFTWPLDGGGPRLTAVSGGYF